MSLRRPRVITAALAVSLLGLAGCTADSVLNLEVGDCLDSEALTGDEVSSVPTVECSEEHDAEVFGEYVLSGDDYPGQQEVTEQSDAECRAQFEEFIGVHYEESTLHFVMLYPMEETWNQADDRTTLCIVEANEPMTGSLAGSKL